MRKNIYLKCAALPCIALGLLTASSAQAKVKAPPSQQIVQSDEAAQERLYFPESNLYQKPGSPVRYAYSIPKNIQPGQSVTLDVTLSEPFTDGNLVVTCRTRGDVTLHGGSFSDSFSMSGTGTHNMQVTFTAGSAGRHYIQFQAVSETAELGARPRHFSIPVQVGPVQPQKPNPHLKVMPNGEAIIAMPAQEVIR